MLAHSEVVSSIVHTNSFICKQLNCLGDCYSTLSFLHMVKWLQVLLCNINNSIFIQKYGFKHSYQTQMILFSIKQLFAYSHNWIQVLLSHHHYFVVPSAQISLTLSRHPSLSFIASVRSPGLHPVSSQSCCM